MARRSRTLSDLPTGDAGTPEGLVRLVRLLARQAARDAMERVLTTQEDLEHENRKSEDG